MIFAWLQQVRQWVWPSKPRILDVAVRHAVMQACADVGLNADGFSGATDLVALHPAKAVEVLHLAASRLGKRPELRTVDDVVSWLLEAPSV